MMRLFMDAGANVDMPTFDGITPLHMAIQLQCVPAARLLIEARARHDCTVADTTFTALASACVHGLMPLVQHLSSFGASRDVVMWHADGESESAIEFAENHEHFDIVNWLRESVGWTALHHIEVLTTERARTLLNDGGMLLTKPDEANETVLERARAIVAQGGDAAVVARLILTHGRLRRWRTIARASGRLVCMRHRAALRLYVPGGSGYGECFAAFEENAKRQRCA